MLIYEMHHLPTGKVYIGALKDSNRWLSYNTSSKIVCAMMCANPQEWTRHILLDKFCADISWGDVVALEQKIIEITAKTIGWDKMWNAGVYKGQAKMVIANTELYKDPEWRKKNKQRVLDLYQDPAYLEIHRIKMKKVWANPEYRQRQKASIQKNSRENEQWKINNKLANQKRFENPVLRQWFGDFNRAKALDPEFRKRHKLAMQKLYQDPIHIAKMQKISQDPEYRKKISDANKGRSKPKVICPHCNKEGGIGAMMRWHFDNCKQKSNP